MGPTRTRSARERVGKGLTQVTLKEPSLDKVLRDLGLKGRKLVNSKKVAGLVRKLRHEAGNTTKNVMARPTRIWMHWPSSER